MDATTDLPMKNENFVFDTTLKLSIFTTDTAGYASFAYPVAIS